MKEDCSLLFQSTFDHGYLIINNNCIQYNYYHLPSVQTVYCSMSILNTAPRSQVIGQLFYFIMSSLSLDLLALDTTPWINGYFSYVTHTESRLQGGIPAEVEHRKVDG